MHTSLPIVFLSLISSAVAAPQNSGTYASPVPYQGLIVGLTPGSTAADVAGSSLQVIQEGLVAHQALLDLPYGPSQRGYARALRQLALDPRVSFVEPNYRLSAPEVSACDSATPSAQSCTIAFFDSDPDTIRYFDQPALAAIDVGPAWDLLGNQLVVVAVIDTGIDPSHEVLQDQIHDLGWDFVTGNSAGIDVADNIDNDGDGYIDEAYGHGTHVAGTIALINPNARLMPLRVLNSDGNGSAWNVAQAIEYATLAGAQFINLSLGMHQRSEAVVRALKLAHEADVEVLASAGNTGNSRLLFPARHEKTLSIGATDNLDILAPFSAYGQRLDALAPGVDIYGPMPEGRFAWWSGCSMATAVATGAASLVYAIAPSEPEDANDAMMDTAVDIDPGNPGAEGLLGDGRIDVLQAALEMIDESHDS
ncbi:MAG: subtilisin family serine protease [Planctomycetota bacterium]|jgi:subtilisin family serine protease